MRCTEFPEQTIVIAKDQPPYAPLPAYLHGDDRGTITCCWCLSWRERLTVLLTGRVWHSVLTFGYPLMPQLLRVDRPEMRPATTHVEASAGVPAPLAPREGA